MKKKLNICPLLGLILALTVLSCHKNASDLQQQPNGQPLDSTQLTVQPDTAATPPYPITASSGCSYAPNYGDSIVYPQPNNNADYIVKPVNAPGPGKYFAWPHGMVIDSLTGAINVTQSETGMKFAIGFVKSGSRDTCVNSLIIGGAGYADSVYVLADGAKSAVPYFDANPYLPSPCKNGNGNGSGCAFDVSSSASKQRVIIDKNTGIIDLNKTLNGSGNSLGAFGLLPYNGETIYTTIYYKVNDESNNALQHIQIRLVYYNSKAQVDQATQTNILLGLLNLLTGNLLSTTTNPRPPLVVIVRSK